MIAKPRHAALRRTWLTLAIVGFLLTALILIAACGQAPAATPTAPAPKAAAVPTEKPVSAEQAAKIKVEWEAGPHNNTYDLYHGPNTYCARCHSPKKWDPKATVGKPPNCFSCKFPTDKAVRISPLAPLIEEADWKVIGCDNCHPTDAQGNVSAKVAIWNNATSSYDAVKSNTALCEKCHIDSLGGTRHKIRLGGGAHSNQIGQTVKRPEECTDCHNPHSAKASCASCHEKAMANTNIVAHTAAHKTVTCVACHDATDMKVGVDPNTKMVTTGTVAVSGGVETFTAEFSHDFKKGVTCTRCHFDKNPFNIRSMVTPTPAASPSAAAKPATTPVATPTK